MLCGSLSNLSAVFNKHHFLEVIVSAGLVTCKHWTKHLDPLISSFSIHTREAAMNQLHINPWFKTSLL